MHLDSSSQILWQFTNSTVWVVCMVFDEPNIKPGVVLPTHFPIFPFSGLENRRSQTHLIRVAEKIPTIKLLVKGDNKCNFNSDRSVFLSYWNSLTSETDLLPCNIINTGPHTAAVNNRPGHCQTADTLLFAGAAHPQVYICWIAAADVLPFHRWRKLTYYDV